MVYKSAHGNHYMYSHVTTTCTVMAKLLLINPSPLDNNEVDKSMDKNFEDYVYTKLPSI